MKANVIQRSLNDITTIVTSQLYTTLAATSAAWHQAYSINANGFPAMANYAACFDQYRIKRVWLKFDPQQSGVSVIASTFEFWTDPKMYYVTDTDDATAFSSTNQYVSRPDFRIIPCFGGHNANDYVVSFVPKVSLDSAGTASVTVSSPWLDTGNLTVPYYGFKICNTFVYAPGIDFCNIFITAEIELRRSK
jgi:hypothetical protein